MDEKFELLNILVVPPLTYNAPPFDMALFLLNIELEIFKSLKVYIAPPLFALFEVKLDLEEILVRPFV
ncbi:hypothetical protein MBCUR_04990 [Methanobrevibacter curvatus]|uniref:Uncharacterized protein n=1 Tax=Methanobrevibacter curvatus TaxID=49547 RepID=A0A166CHJ9_9EURY|nr:hypothetical protein MBCUR_04990 [Methanobrevibacter curvatus]